MIRKIQYLLKISRNKKRLIFVALINNYQCSAMLNSEDFATTELLSRREFLLSNLPNKLTKDIICSHYKPQQFSYCPTKKTYLFQIGDFSSLQRILKDNHIVLQKLADDMLQLFKRVDQIKCLPTKVIPQIIGPWRLLPHQLEEISFFQKKGGKIIIGDGWGMGKTITAISIIEIHKIHCVLIVCSQILLYHWSQSLIQLFDEQQIKILQSQKDFNLAQQTKPYLLISNADVKFISGDSSKLQLLIIDQPQIEWKDYCKIRNAKNIIIISRNGSNKLCQLIPLLMKVSSLSENSLKMRLKQRYQVQGNGEPLKHIYEFNVLSSHFLICHKDEWFKLKTFKPILMFSQKLNQTSRLQQIQSFHQNRFKQICCYIQYLLTVYSTKLIIVYKSQWLIQFLQSILQNNQRKQLLIFVNFTQVKLTKLAENSIILFLQTFKLDDDEEIINQSMEYLHKVTHQIQYIKFSEQEEKITGTKFYYPQFINKEYISQIISISESIQAIPVPQIEEIKKKQILVYFDLDEPQNQMVIDHQYLSSPKIPSEKQKPQEFDKNNFDKDQKYKKNLQQIGKVSWIISQKESKCNQFQNQHELNALDQKQQKEQSQPKFSNIISKNLVEMQQKVQKQTKQKQIIQTNRSTSKLLSAFTINIKPIFVTNQSTIQNNPDAASKNKKQRNIRKKSTTPKLCKKTMFSKTQF